MCSRAETRNRHGHRHRWRETCEYSSCLQDPSGASIPIPGADTFETVARKVMRPLQGVHSHRVERASALGERSGGHYQRSKPSRRILGRNRRDRPARTTYPLSRDPRLDRSVGRYSRDSLLAGEVQAHLCLSLGVACPVDIGSANRSPPIPEITGMTEGVGARPGSSEILAPY